MRPALHALLLASWAFSPSARAETPYESNVQYALERLASGITTAATVDGTEVMITPLRTWKSISGHYCREYQVVLARPDGSPDRSVAVRCREDTGKWRKIERD